MGRAELEDLEVDFPPFRLKGQEPPEGEWSVWLFMGGRGAGKTRAGAEWVRDAVRNGAGRIGLIGPTFNDVREVMIEGPSGLLSIGRPEERPVYEVTRRRLVWNNGAVAYGFSAEDPDSLRGPQFSAAWGDEFAAWKSPQAALDTLRMGVRLGAKPRVMLTTTPRPIPALKALIGAPGVKKTQQMSSENVHNLGPGFLDAMQAAYGTSLLARQELEGLLIDDPPGALWTRAMIDTAAGAACAPPDRIVVAIDPPASGGPNSDECGIIVAGAAGEGLSRRAIVLADKSFGPAMPADWAARAVDAFETFEADAVIAEANQGGDMVRSVLQSAHPGLPVRLVHATRGKHVRAEPVAALYSAGRIVHADRFAALEDQMCAFGSGAGGYQSPDRVDALVWAITELLLQARSTPRLRRL